MSWRGFPEPEGEDIYYKLSKNKIWLFVAKFLFQFMIICLYFVGFLLFWKPEGFTLSEMLIAMLVALLMWTSMEAGYYLLNRKKKDENNR